jgi:hypothetical protein
VLKSHAFGAFWFFGNRMEDCDGLEQIKKILMDVMEMDEDSTEDTQDECCSSALRNWRTLPQIRGDAR